MNCYICKEKKLYKFLDLGSQPPSDAFLTADELNKPEQKFPLGVELCENCFLVQLDYAVDPKILFNRDFVYTTGTNNSLRASFKALVENLTKRFNFGPKDFAIDIGSNDGTLLKNYLSAGIKVLGIDPAGAAAELAIRDGVETLVDYFNESVAKEVLKKHGQASVITSTNTFAHIHELDSTMKGIALLLRPTGVFISDSHYLLDMVEKLQYDWIYHEHLRHYSMRPLQKLFDRFGMETFDVERVKEGHGGSIRVYAAKKGAFPISKNVADLIETETEAGLYEKETFEKFASRVAENKRALQSIVQTIKKEGCHIVGIGAPAKGNTLLNYCELSDKEIDYLAEKSPFKIGKFAPGSHIPVVDEERLYREQPEYALILSWNLSEELMPKLRKNGYKGKFIIPNPTPRIAE